MDVGFDNDDYDFGEESYDNDYDVDPRHARYQEAYGGYTGGYPSGPMGPSRPFGGPPPQRFRPPPLFSPRPPFPGMMGSRPPRFRPYNQSMKDVKQSAIGYLIRCGLSKDFIKKVPKEILPMLGPEHCGLCGFDFNSFSLSRVHYNSKAHLNAQKKFINQRNGLHTKSIEQPMKSRELYCELCDVQITSKVHGDSHYAGKPHRSIVEGRKMPKNPMLLQPGHEKRLDQLIRREKRCLSKKGEAGEGEGDETIVVPKVETKIIPELYCKICKTAVTCSEQMTMHMNGKKHLSKEKQHILKMMAGEKEDDAAEEMAEEEEDVKQDVTEEGDTVDEH